MPDDGRELTGFTPAAALWRLLRAKGYEESFQIFQENHWLDDTAEAMTEPLKQAGIQARLALIQPEELRYLACPTLLRLKNGSWLLLRARSRRGFQVEAPQGAFAQTFQELKESYSGQALDLSPPMGTGSLWRRLWTLAAHHRPNLSQIALATLLLQFLGLAGPLITGVILNRALPNGAHSLLGLVAAGTLFVGLFQAWLGWFRGHVLLYLVNHMEVATERALLDHLLRLPFPFLQKRTVGELLQAFNGLSAARELLMEKTLGSLLDGAMAILYLGAMAWILPGPTLAAFAATLLIAAITLAAGRGEARLQGLGIELQAREQGYLSELMAGIGTVKAAGAEIPAHQRWNSYYRKELSLGLRQGRIRIWTDAGLGTLSQGLGVFLLIWGGRLVLDGALRLGTLFVFLQLSTAFTGAVMGVVDIGLSLILLGPQLAKAEAILAIPTETPLPKPHPMTPSLPGPALMEDVWFRYTPEGPWVLSGFNLQVESGDKFTLKGASGCGKTTVLRLMAGLFTPEKGTISIGGLSPRQARPSLLYLPQFIQIMGGTVMENLRVLAGGATLEAILRAARRSGLEDLAATLPMGYNTLLPHGGRSLSGGQRQLIAITAALASGRPLLLLDEAMANLDLQRSAVLAEALAEAPWTVISASHGRE